MLRARLELRARDEFAGGISDSGNAIVSSSNKISSSTFHKALELDQIENNPESR